MYLSHQLLEFMCMSKNCGVLKYY